jgi:hypothetical protein
MAATLYSRAKQAYQTNSSFESLLQAIGSSTDAFTKNILDLRHDAGKLTDVVIPSTNYSIMSMTDMLSNSLVPNSNIGTNTRPIVSDEAILDRLETMSPYYYPDTDITKWNNIAAGQLEGSTFKIYPYTASGMHELQTYLATAGCNTVMIDAFFGNPFRFRSAAGTTVNGFGGAPGQPNVTLVNHVVSQCDGATKPSGASLAGIVQEVSEYDSYDLPAFYSRGNNNNNITYTNHNFQYVSNTGTATVRINDTEGAITSVSAVRSGFSVNTIMKSIGLPPPRGAAKIIKDLSVVNVRNPQSNEDYRRGHVAYIKTITDWAQYAVALEKGLKTTQTQRVAVFLNDRFGLRMTGILGNHFVVQAPSTFHDYVILHSFNENARKIDDNIKVQINNAFTNPAYFVLQNQVVGVQDIRNKIQTIINDVSAGTSLVDFTVYVDLIITLNELNNIEALLVGGRNTVQNNNNIPDSFYSSFIYLNNQTPQDYVQKMIKNKISIIYQKINRFAGAIQNKVAALKDSTRYDTQQEIFDQLVSFIEYYIDALKIRVQLVQNNIQLQPTTEIALKILATININQFAVLQSSGFVTMVYGQKALTQLKTLLGQQRATIYQTILDTNSHNEYFSKMMYGGQSLPYNLGQTTYRTLANTMLTRLNQDLMNFPSVPIQNIIQTVEDNLIVEEATPVIEDIVTESEVKIKKVNVQNIIQDMDTLSTPEGVAAYFNVSENKYPVSTVKLANATRILRTRLNQLNLTQKQRNEIIRRYTFGGDKLKISLIKPVRSSFRGGAIKNTSTVNTIPFTYYSHQVDDDALAYYVNMASAVPTNSYSFKPSLCHAEIQEFMARELPIVGTEIYNFCQFIKELYEVYFSEDAYESNMGDDVLASMSHLESVMKGWEQSLDITDYDLIKQVGYYLFEDRATSYLLNALDPNTDIPTLMSAFLGCLRSVSSNEEEVYKEVLQIKKPIVGTNSSEEPGLPQQNTIMNKNINMNMPQKILVNTNEEENPMGVTVGGHRRKTARRRYRRRVTRKRNKHIRASSRRSKNNDKK